MVRPLDYNMFHIISEFWFSSIVIIKLCTSSDKHLNQRTFGQIWTTQISIDWSVLLLLWCSVGSHVVEIWCFLQKWVEIENKIKRITSAEKNSNRIGGQLITKFLNFVAALFTPILTNFKKNTNYQNLNISDLYV